MSDDDERWDAIEAAIVNLVERLEKVKKDYGADNSMAISEFAVGADENHQWYQECEENCKAIDEAIALLAKPRA